MEGGGEWSAVLMGKDPGVGSWRDVVFGNETDLFGGVLWRRDWQGNGR